MIGAIKEDTRSLDYGSCMCKYVYGCAHVALGMRVVGVGFSHKEAN